MKQRLNIHVTGQAAMKAMYGLGSYALRSGLESDLLHLVFYRVSQINGCAFCLDMHAKDLLAGGEDVQRLLVLDAWREAPFYTDRERTALAWAEALTTLRGQVPDDQYAASLQHFSEQELIDLTMGVIAINGYNRINLAFPPANVGSYQPGQFAVGNK